MTTRNDKLVSILTLLSTLTGAADAALVQLRRPRPSMRRISTPSDLDTLCRFQRTRSRCMVCGTRHWHAFGEIQIAIANEGRALHEFAPSTNPSGLQTIDRRDLGALDATNAANNITLSTNFYAHTSDLSGSNIYSANFRVTGGPHPGFDIVGFGLFGGHFVPKNVTGVSVALGLFNGVDNNEPLPLTVGQHLTWDAWHTLTFSIDQLADRYVSITVDGATQDLSAYRPPRSGSVRGQTHRNSCW